MNVPRFQRRIHRDRLPRVPLAALRSTLGFNVRRLWRQEKDHRFDFEIARGIYQVGLGRSRTLDPSQNRRITGGWGAEESRVLAIELRRTLVTHFVRCVRDRMPFERDQVSRLE